MKIRLLLLLSAFFLSYHFAAAQTVEKGNASYYSAKLKGRKTASGELYNADSLMCAHKTQPFGTLLRVYNPKTDKEVVVKVTDRGPFRKNFIVDLSYSAAKQIGILRAGYMPVEVTVVGKAPIYKSSKSSSAEKKHSARKHYSKKKSSKKHKAQGKTSPKKKSTKKHSNNKKKHTKR